MATACSIHECARPTIARSFCRMHYQRWRKHGDPTVTLVDRHPPTTCTLTGCDRSFYARGLCAMHYNRRADGRAPGGSAPLIAPAGTGHVNDNGYRVLHRPDHPLGEQRAQGKIEEHRVVLFDAIGPGPHACHWCGCPVGWWAEDGTLKLQADHVNDDRLDNRPDNLVPACRPCNTTRGRS